MGSAFVGDAELNYKLTDALQLSVGANNVFNKRPPTYDYLPAAAPPYTVVNGGNVYDAPLTFSPYGINGGYYYGRIDIHF